MTQAFDAIRGALAGLELGLDDGALDRVAAAAAAEMAVASAAPVAAVMQGAPWVTLKAGPSATAETIGSLKEGGTFLAGRPEGPWRPVYGTPLGWVSANLVEVSS